MAKNVTTCLIEFNGLPGCGKSTVCSNLQNHLLSMGYTVGDIKTLLDDVGLNNRLKKMFCLLRPFMWQCFFNLKRFSSHVTPYRKEQNAHIRMALWFFFSYHTILKNKNPKQFYLIDQGILQELISIVYIDSFDDHKLILPLLKNLLSELCIYEVNCSIAPQEDFRRIRSRNIIQGRFDLMDDNNLLDNLKMQTRHLILFREALNVLDNVHSITINMDEDYLQNTCSLLNIVLN